MNRRIALLAPLLPALLQLSGCAHSGHKVVVLLKPTALTTAVDIVIPTRYSLGLTGEDQIARFKTPEFGAMASALASELIAFNGLVGAGVVKPSRPAVGRHFVDVVPAGFVYFYQRVNGLVFACQLCDPTGVVLLRWEHTVNMGFAVFNGDKWADYETAAAFMILAALNTVQNAGYVRLKYQPARSLSGAINPGVGGIR
jgi:hypothetical protein